MGVTDVRRQEAIPIFEDFLRGTRRRVLTRRQVDCIPVERIRPVRDLRAAVPGTGREVSDLDQRRHTTALEQKRHGDLLRVVGRQNDGRACEVIAGWPSLETGTPVVLFSARIVTTVTSKQQYAVSSDGQRFLVNLAVDEGATSPITIIYNWKPKVSP